MHQSSMIIVKIVGFFNPKREWYFSFKLTDWHFVFLPVTVKRVDQCSMNLAWMFQTEVSLRNVRIFNLRSRFKTSARERVCPCATISSWVFPVGHCTQSVKKKCNCLLIFGLYTHGLTKNGSYDRSNNIMKQTHEILIQIPIWAGAA